MAKAPAPAPAPAPYTFKDSLSNLVSITVDGNKEALRTITQTTVKMPAAKGTLSDGSTVTLANGNLTLVMGNGAQIVEDFRNTSDTLYTNNAGDSLYDKRGWDTSTTKAALPIAGNGGHLFYGGNGKDFLYDYGNATLGSYSDTLFGNNGADYIWGGNGKDVEVGGQAGDLLHDAYGAYYHTTDTVQTTFSYFTKSTTNSVSDSTYTSGAAVAYGVYAPWDVIWGFDVGVDKLDFWGSWLSTTMDPNLKAATGMSLGAAAAINGGLLNWLGIRTTDAAAGTADADARSFGIWQNDDTGTLGANAIDQFVYVDIDGDGKADAKIQVNVGFGGSTDVGGNAMTRPFLALKNDTGPAAGSPWSGDKYTSDGTVKIVNFISPSDDPTLTYEYTTDGTTWHALPNTSVGEFQVDPSLITDSDGVPEAVKVRVSNGSTVPNSTQLLYVTSSTLSYTLDTYVATPSINDLLTDSADNSDNITNTYTGLDVSGPGSEPTTPASPAPGAFSYTYEYKLNGNTVSGVVDDDINGTGDGNYTVTVKVTDKAGNVSANSTVYSFTLDNLITAATIDLHTDSGADDNYSNKSTLDISAPHEDGTRVITLDATNTMPANWDGSELDDTHANDGNHTVTVKDTDVAGNTVTKTYNFTLDTQIGGITASAADSAPAGVVEPGALLHDHLTNDATITASDPDTWDLNDSNSEADRDYFVDNLDDTIAGSHSDSYTLPTTDGHYIVTITDTDKAGNATHTDVLFTLDKTLKTPVLSLDNDGNPVVSGAEETLYSRVYNVTDDTNTVTHYTGDFPGDLGPGTYVVTVTDTDLAGNTKTSNPVDYSLDDTPDEPTHTQTWIVSKSTPGYFDATGLPGFDEPDFQFVGSSFLGKGVTFFPDGTGNQENDNGLKAGTVKINDANASGIDHIYYSADGINYEVTVLIKDFATQGEGGALTIDLSALQYDQSYIKAGHGDDSPLGLSGSGASIDNFYGGQGNDVLQGGAGNDYVEGGGGNDDFVYKGASDAFDVIGDFNWHPTGKDGENGEQDQLIFTGISGVWWDSDGNGNTIVYIGVAENTLASTAVVVLTGVAESELQLGVNVIV